MVPGGDRASQMHARLPRVSVSPGGSASINMLSRPISGSDESCDKAVSW